MLGDRWKLAKNALQQQEAGRGCRSLLLVFEDLLGGGHVDTTDHSSAHTLCVYWSGRVPTEHAAITALAKKHKDLRVVGVVNFRMNKGAAEARKSLAMAKVTWPHCYDADKIQNPFESACRTPRTPFYYWLDRDGNVERFACQWSVMSTVLSEQSL